ncbi:hypothetical protein AURDEDRAFT_114831 [Auricularia subglabra TFB-10046 SS5]|nr:hypothetical protein AURDEDRAFT_114831 [Auricularia subglabra TFB-10046 SS5]
MDTARLVALVEQQQTVNFNAIAAAALVLYDALISADREVELVWRRRWDASKLLHLLTRASGLALLIANAAASLSAHDAEFCKQYQYFNTALSQVLFTLVELVLAQRICTVYRHNRILRLSIFSLSSASITAQTVVIGLAFGMCKPEPQLLPQHATGCLSSDLPQQFAAYWWPPFILHTIVAILAVWHVGAVARRNAAVEALGTVVKHEGVLFFLAAWAVLLCELVFHHTGESMAARATALWVFAIFYKAGTGVHLNEQEAVKAVSERAPLPSASNIVDGFIIVQSPGAAMRRNPEWFGTASTATTTVSVEFAPQRALSPDNSRVAAFYDAGDAYVPVSRRNAIDEETPPPGHSWLRMGDSPLPFH